MHNACMWAKENSHAIRGHAALTSFFVSVWAGIIEDHLIGPHLLPFYLTGHNYLLFLSEASIVTNFWKLTEFCINAKDNVVST